MDRNSIFPSSSQGSVNRSSARISDGGALRHLWLSPWTVWVGFRYLKSKKNSRFLSFITILSFLGVGLGVTAMIVVLSVMDGFESELKKRMMSSDLHVLIQPNRDTPGFHDGFVPADTLNDTQRAQLQKALGNQLVSFFPIVSTEAILKAGRRVTGVVLKGLAQEQLDGLAKQMVESADSQLLMQKQAGDSVNLPGVYLGQELAFEMGLIPGDHVTLVSPTEMDGPLSSIPRFQKYFIQGIYHLGLPEVELHTVFTKAEAVRSFLRKSNVVSQWEISVRDFEQAPQVANYLREQLPNLQISDWMQLNSHLFASLHLERVSMFIILTFIIIVASFNIVTTLTLMVLEKKREISILKAMGARHGQVAAVFLAEGLLIGVLGTGGGLALGFLICSLLRRYEFITLPDIYYDRTLPVTFNGLYYGLVAFSALVIVLIACLYPSKRAAQLNPLDGIRFG